MPPAIWIPWSDRCNRASTSVFNAGVGGGTTNYPIAATIGPVAIDGKGRLPAGMALRIGYDWVFLTASSSASRRHRLTDVEDRFALDGKATAVNGVPIGSAGGNIGTADYLGTVQAAPATWSPTRGSST